MIYLIKAKNYAIRKTKNADFKGIKNLHPPLWR